MNKYIFTFKRFSGISSWSGLSGKKLAKNAVFVFVEIMNFSQLLVCNSLFLSIQVEVKPIVLINHWIDKNIQNIESSQYLIRLIVYNIILQKLELTILKYPS